MPDPRPDMSIHDEDGFRRELGRVLRAYDVDRYLEFDTATAVARVVEFIELMRVCHEADRDIALSLGPERDWSALIPPLSAPPSVNMPSPLDDPPNAVTPQQIPRHRWKQE